MEIYIFNKNGYHHIWLSCSPSARISIKSTESLPTDELQYYVEAGDNEQVVDDLQSRQEPEALLHHAAALPEERGHRGSGAARAALPGGRLVGCEPHRLGGVPAHADAGVLELQQRREGDDAVRAAHLQPLGDRELPDRHHPERHHREDGAVHAGLPRGARPALRCGRVH